jgi:succinate dehydrogenase / fumarate reductase membrane anchor subunit
MTAKVKGLGPNGVRDWYIQRFSSLLLAAYTLLLLGVIWVTPELNFQAWHRLFAMTWMQIATVVALLAACAHAWIGMWTIGTDYLSNHHAGNKATSLRYGYQFLCVLVLIVYVIWGMKILWGNQ